MIKILAVSHGYLDPFSRVGLIDAKQYPEFEVTVLVPGDLARKHREGFRKLQEDCKEVHAIQTFFNFHQSVKAYSLQLLRLLKKTKPDIIFIANEPWSTTALQMILFARLLGLRSKIIVYTCENMVRKYLLPFRWFEKYVLSNTDMVLTLPKEEAKTVLLEYKAYRGRIEYLPLAVETSIFKKVSAVDLRKTFVNGKNIFLVGFVGRLVKEKGIGLIIEAIKELGEQFGCVIIGDGPERESLQQIAERLGVRNRVVFVNNVFHDNLPKYLSSLDAVILPSLTTSNWKEQFGRVLVEAMACEVPVIGSSSGEIPVVIGKAGLVFKEGDVGDLSANIRLLCGDRELRRRLSVEGRKRAVEFYDAEVIMDITAKFYKELLNNATAR